MNTVDHLMTQAKQFPSVRLSDHYQSFLLELILCKRFQGTSDENDIEESIQAHQSAHTVSEAIGATPDDTNEPGLYLKSFSQRISEQVLNTRFYQ